MKNYSILLLSTLILSCNQSHKAPANEPGSETSAIDSSARRFLIDITNSSWYQVELAQLASKKSHDTSVASIAASMSKQYMRIRDRAKIVSIPYKINAPYFLTGEQNERLKELSGMDSISFNKEFFIQAKQTDDLILKQCNSVNTSKQHDNSLEQLIDFCKSIVDETGKKVQGKI